MNKPKLKYPIAVTISLGILFSFHTSVYALDLGRALKESLNKGLRNNQNQGFNLFGNSECAALKSWVSNAPATAAGRSSNAQNLLPLVQDEVFVPKFGKPYDQLTVGDFSKFQRETKPACMKERSLAPLEWQIVNQVWSNQNPYLVSQLAKMRNDKNEIQSILSQLPTLQPNEADLAKLESFEKRFNELNSQLPPEKSQEFQKLLTEARAKIANPVEEARYTQMVQSASGSDGLSKLIYSYVELSNKSFPEPTKTDLLNKMNNKINELSPAVLSSEKATLSPVANNLGSLSKSTAWVRAFDSKYNNLYGRLTEFKAFSDEVNSQRQSLINNHQQQIVTEIKRASSVTAASSVVSNYFLDNELFTEPGSSVKQFKDDRIAQLQKDSKNKTLFAATNSGDINQQTTNNKSKFTNGSNGNPQDLSDVEMYEMFEFGNIVAGIYEGKSELFAGINPIFLNRYLIAQAKVLATEFCLSVKLRELQSYENATKGSEIDNNIKTQWGVITDSINIAETSKAKDFWGNMKNNTINISNQQAELNNAKNYGTKDIAIFYAGFAKEKCKSSAMKQYTKNLKSYLKNGIQ